MINIKDKNLFSLLNNKRIAIVGPSPHLIDKNIGDIIDSYDLVCRVNEVSAWNYEKDYGSKTDIIFHNCGAHCIDFFKYNLEKNTEITNNIKYIICPCIKAKGQDNFSNWQKDYVSGVVENFKNINSFNLPYYWIGVEEYLKVYNSIGVEPNAGITSILFLLSCMPKELFITGFSFYNQGDFGAHSLRPGHSIEENERTGNFGHQQYPQILFFTNFIMKNFNNIIKIDSYLNDYLKLSHNNLVFL
jgi:hypothetical protein